jgi:hypothetical protein
MKLETSFVSQARAAGDDDAAKERDVGGHDRRAEWRYFRRITPDVNSCVSTSARLIRARTCRNTGVPAPRTIGTT